VSTEERVMGLFTKKNKSVAAPVVDVRVEPVIDLTGAPAAAPTIQWGFPTRCPECGDFGYLDRIDVVREVMYQHCPTCWAKWETPKSATTDA
jgi:hypothetical protein